MQSELNFKNIVLAGVFNPAIFDKYYFIKNNVVGEDEILSSSVFDPSNTIQLISNKFSVVVIFNQIIITDSDGSSSDEIYTIAMKIIETMKNPAAIAGGVVQSMLNAIGINFSWFLKDADEPLSKTTKKHFYNNDLELYRKYFNSDDSAFGIYASSNYQDSRLKLEIKPTLSLEHRTGSIAETIGFIFNYHFDINNNYQQAINVLENYETYKLHTEEIISNYTR